MSERTLLTLFRVAVTVFAIAGIVVRAELAAADEGHEAEPTVCDVP